MNMVPPPQHTHTCTYTNADIWLVIEYLNVVSSTPISPTPFPQSSFGFESEDVVEPGISSGGLSPHILHPGS